MKYIADFNRSRPLFECVDQPIFTAALPDWEASSTKFGRQYKKWCRQVELWQGKLQSEASLRHHPLCGRQATDVVAAVTELTRLLGFLHLNGPNPEVQVHIAWNLHGMGRSQAALSMLRALAEEVAVTYGEDSTDFADFLWMTAEMQMATEDWAAAYENAENAKYTYISNLGEGSEEDQKCHWLMAHAKLLSAQYAQAERLARGFVDGTVPGHPRNSSIYPARALQLRAVTEAIQRNFAGAADLLRRAQEAACDMACPPADFQPRLNVFRGILCRKLGIWHEAEQLLLSGRAQLATLLSAKHLDVGRASLEAARFYVLREDHEVADRLFQEALDIFQPLKHARQEQAIAAFFRARLFRIQGKKGKARNAARVGRQACAALGAPLSEWALRLRLEVIHLQLAAEAFEDARDEIQALLTEGRSALRTPQLGELKLLQGRTWLALGQISAARTVLQEVADFQEEPEDLSLVAHARQDLAAMGIAEKDFARACACLDASVATLQDASDRSLLRGRYAFLHGRMTLLQGNYRMAVTHFEQGAVELKRGDQRHEYLQAECWLGKAEALIAQNDWGAAIKHLKRYTDSKAWKKLQTEGHRARVQYLLGMALFLAGNTRKSHGYIKKAVNRLEADAGARHNAELYLNACIQLAIGCRSRPSYSEAIDALTTMLRHLEGYLHRYPKELSTIHLLLGEAFAGAAQVEPAAHHYRQCLALRARYVGASQTATLQVHSLLAELYQAHAMHDEALAELRQKCAKSDFVPGSRADQAMQLEIARQQYHLGRFPEALATLQLLPPVDSGAHIDPLTAAWLMGQCHLGAGTPEQAIRVWNRVKELKAPSASEPWRPQIRQGLAELYLAQGDPAAAHLHYAAAFALLDQAGDRKGAFRNLLKATQLLQDLGRSQEYVQNLVRAQEYACAHRDSVSQAKAMQVCSALAEIRREQERHDEALSLYRTTIAWGHPTFHQKHLPLVAHCQLQAALLEQPTEAVVRLAWIGKEYRKHKAGPDLTLARSYMALANLFWDSGRTTAALKQAVQAVRIYGALEMSGSVEFAEACHSLALLQSDAAQTADAAETLAALQHQEAAGLSRNFTLQNLEDHLRLLHTQKQAQSAHRQLRAVGGTSNGCNPA